MSDDDQRGCILAALGLLVAGTLVWTMIGLILWWGFW